MKVYTKTGDSGQTSLFSGGRVNKNDERLEAYGTLDELNTVLGLLRTESLSDDVDEQLELIQNALFEISAQIADAENRFQGQPAHWDPALMERWIDDMSANLTPLKNFILPGGTRSASLAHLARTICRRAERRLITADERFSCAPEQALAFLNRLSDAFFVLARYLNWLEGIREPIWSTDSDAK